MSTDDDTELRDLVAQTLESNGVLGKIRSQLRASVFLALEEQEQVKNQTPLLNQPLLDFLGTEEGSLVACLVREFLDHFHLEFTLAVYDPESGHKQDYTYHGREQLIEDLQLGQLNGRKEPLLVEILKRAKGQTDGGKRSQKHTKSSDQSLSESSSRQNSGSLESGPSSVEEETSTLSGSGREASQSDRQEESESSGHIASHAEETRESQDSNNSIGGRGNVSDRDKKVAVFSGKEYPQNSDKKKWTGDLPPLPRLGGKTDETHEMLEDSFFDDPPKINSVNFPFSEPMPSMPSVKQNKPTTTTTDEQSHQTVAGELSGPKDDGDDSVAKSVSEELDVEEEEQSTSLGDLLDNSLSGIDDGLTADETINSSGGVADYIEKV